MQQPDATANHNELTGPSISLSQRLRLRISVWAIKRLLIYFPGDASLLARLGTTELHLGNHKAALEYYDRAIKLSPDDSDIRAYRQLAMQKVSEQKSVSKAANYPSKPDRAKSKKLHSLGLKCLEEHRPEEALACFDRAVSLNPDFAEAHHNLGRALEQLRWLEDALASYDKAIALHADYPEAFVGRGNVLGDLNQVKEALASYDKAIALKPDFAEAYSNRGATLLYLRPEEALANLEQAIVLRPDYADAYNNRGIALYVLRRLEEALTSYDRAIGLRPDYADAFNNRGNALYDLRRLEEALTSYDRAIGLRPDYADAYFAKSTLKLLTGDFEEGWQLYEWRWKSVLRKSYLRLSQPLWLGQQSIVGKTLLIHPEQGLGDVIQFCRYALMAETLGANVVIGVPKPLMALLSSLPGKFRIVESGEPIPDFDLHCPMMSLPLAFKTTLSTIPGKVPYLFAEKEKQAAWHERLGPKTKPRVGLVWSGGFRPDQPDVWAVNERRNIKLSMMACLRALNVDFYSLQKGQPAESEHSELKAAAWDGPNIIDYTSELNDFSDTAALIENLDLVISVDTSTAHLAAALGKPVWILNRFDTCWRWMLDRTDSPWYPSVALFRQPSPGDWQSVIADVSQRLQEMVENR